MFYRCLTLKVKLYLNGLVAIFTREINFTSIGLVAIFTRETNFTSIGLDSVFSELGQGEGAFQRKIFSKFSKW